jgi:hypothetical protein
VGDPAAARRRIEGPVSGALPRPDLEYTYEVHEYEPLERLVQGTTSGPFAMETTYTWADAPGGTVMTLRNRGEPEGVMRMLGGVLEPAMRRANRADLARLKALLEGRSAEDT